MLSPVSSHRPVLQPTRHASNRKPAAQAPLRFGGDSPTSETGFDLGNLGKPIAEIISLIQDVTLQILRLITDTVQHVFSLLPFVHGKPTSRHIPPPQTDEPLPAPKKHKQSPGGLKRHHAKPPDRIKRVFWEDLLNDLEDFHLPSDHEPDHRDKPLKVRPKDLGGKDIHDQEAAKEHRHHEEKDLPLATRKKPDDMAKQDGLIPMDLDLEKILQGKKADKAKRLPIPVDFMNAHSQVPPKVDPFVELFGTDIKRNVFRQQNTGDCYLLAGIDALLHHPAGEALLRKIQIEPQRDATDRVIRYKVQFPSGRNVEFDASEVGQPKGGKNPVQGPKAIQILELAYAKMTKDERRRRIPSPPPGGNALHTMQIVESGVTHDALNDMFGGEKLKITAREPYVYGMAVGRTDALSKHPNGMRTLETFLKGIADDAGHHTVISAYTPDELPSGQANPRKIILTRSNHGVPAQQEFCRGHAYSIRHFDMNGRTITIANPHDTSREETLSFEEFCQVFRGITGVRLAK